MGSQNKRFTFYIDVFSYCNLRCPSCTVGNEFGDPHGWPRGLMSVQLLEQILDKALDECEIEAVGLYNWTEPLLHPQIRELIRVVKSRGITCWISSNLNKLPNPEPLVVARPDLFRVSLSGFSQEVYGVTHRGGNIQLVKENMRRLAAALTNIGGAPPHVEVFYHKYSHNVHEMPLMEEFARSLGFAFNSTWAYISPVEKIISLSEGLQTDDDKKLLDILALPLDRALAITSQLHRSTCPLLEEVIALDISGNSMLCCGSSMDRRNIVGNFLQVPLEEMQERRREMSLCSSCLKLGIPDYFLGRPEFDRIAAERLGWGNGA
jgi:MoaA/NifB/PqqE/SkfB family radical SAM enzyme